MEEAPFSTLGLPALICITAAIAILIGWIFSSLSKQTPGSKSKTSVSSKPTTPGKPGGVLQTFTVDEVAKHNKDNDCWIIFKDKVYNVTDYVIMHPGGDAILNNAGGDSTEGFIQAQHPTAAIDTMGEYLIGTLRES